MISLCSAVTSVAIHLCENRSRLKNLLRDSALQEGAENVPQR